MNSRERYDSTGGIYAFARACAESQGMKGRFCRSPLGHCYVCERARLLDWEKTGKLGPLRQSFHGPLDLDEGSF
jgi:hypothetical protein